MEKVRLMSLMLAVLLIGMTSCDKEKIDIADLPASIENFVNGNFADYKIDESEKETLCDGTEVFEVEIEDSNDNELELVFDLEGNHLYTETEISIEELPTAVSESINTNYAGYSVEEAEKLDWADDTVQYEVELKKDNTELEVIFDANGIVLCEEEDND